LPSSGLGSGIDPYFCGHAPLIRESRLENNLRMPRDGSLTPRDLVGKLEAPP
jgi:hypothetical protein